MKWVIAAVGVFVAGYMCVDGVHAFLTGYFITPSSGPYAGHLGPWANVVIAVGLTPLSTYTKAIFVCYGALWLAFLAYFLLGRWWAKRALMVMSVGALWYLWLGTVCALVSIALLLAYVPRPDPGDSGEGN